MVTGIGTPIHGIALSLTNNYIFWTQDVGPEWRVTRSNLDGTGKQDGGYRPWGFR